MRKGAQNVCFHVVSIPSTASAILSGPVQLHVRHAGDLRSVWPKLVTQRELDLLPVIVSMCFCLPNPCISSASQIPAVPQTYPKGPN